MFCQAIEDLRLPKPGNAIRMPWMSLGDEMGITTPRRITEEVS
jgi:hypothetical protein